MLLAANKKEKFVAIKALFCAVVLPSTAGVKLNRCLYHLLYLGTFEGIAFRKTWMVLGMVGLQSGHEKSSLGQTIIFIPNSKSG
ncbi:Hypothetical protein CpMEX30_0625 [Corynebacterium pseudotuberculosis]|nr:Hypothetical protein CpE19_0590 [Corynebacterium pseudotuberculosis]APQ53708.1 Hypothetical protein CpMEX30_0625 [Corynebacterium pseudotuberculosis]